jgi:hypothetical protein
LLKIPQLKLLFSDVMSDIEKIEKNIKKQIPPNIKKLLVSSTASAIPNTTFTYNFYNKYIKYKTKYFTLKNKL